MVHIKWWVTEPPITWGFENDDTRYARASVLNAGPEIIALEGCGGKDAVFYRLFTDT